MSEPDAILLADFDDEPQSASSPIPADPRPAGRPRPDASSQPPKQAIALAVLDSEAAAVVTGPRHQQLTLPFDLGVLDTNPSAFLVVYHAGTPLDTLNPRTLTIPTGEAGSPVTSLVIHARTATQSLPVPYLPFQFAHDIRGQQLTLRFTNPADPRSLVIDWGWRNGSVCSVLPGLSPAAAARPAS